jgi:basic membrane protein A
MNTVGVNPFLTQVVDKFEELYAEGRFPMEYTIIEAGDIAAFGENIRAAVEEGYDLIISVGFQGADAIAEISKMFPDRAQYVIIDTIADSPYVKSVTFKPSQAAYLIGIVAQTPAKAALSGVMGLCAA